MKFNDLTYSDAIEKVLMNNGYIAPLKLIYREIWNYKNRDLIKGKTPDSTIQERVQRDSRFTKIGLGVYALTKHINDLPKLSEPTSEAEKQERKHAVIQGMLLEIGNQDKHITETYTNDKKWVFNNKTLGSLSTIQKVPSFTFEKIIKDSVTYADVIWFNERLFPQVVFEVENSTNFRDAFVKFMELQDFQTKFYCVSEEKRFDKFKKERDKSAFSPIAKRVNFLSYNQIENDYELAKKSKYIHY